MNKSGFSLVNIDEATFYLDRLKFLSEYAGFDDVMDSLSKHYTENLRYNIIRVLGSTGLLGNQTKLWSTLYQGFIDFY